MKVRTLAALLAGALPCGASAVYLNPDGLGQALVYPYYTAHSAGGNAFNTYLSVVNHGADAKALRVRFREGRAGAEVGGFNLFLSPNDAWVGAVVPAGSGATLLARDRSCIDGLFAIDFSPGAFPYMEFRNTLYTGSRSDGAGDGLDRTREGYIEILEMGVLTGSAAAAVTQNSAGIPANCAAVQGVAALPMAAPTGGLSGTLTLINVASGQDFTVNADALGDLATQPYFRLPADPYPAFDASEISAVSVVTAGRQVYRSQWARGVDAVSAVFMRASLQAEYVLDSGTRSLSDVVVTSPTRHYYVTPTGVAAPYSGAAGWAEMCGANASAAGVGERLRATMANREEGHFVINVPSDYLGPPPSPPPPQVCAAAATFSVHNTAAHMTTGPTSMVLGSINKQANLFVFSSYVNGWLDLAPMPAGSLTSLATSTRIDTSTGAITTGAHRFSGLPVTGLFVRIFQNGTLTCAGGACQGNYGGAFPLRYRREIQ